MKKIDFRAVWQKILYPPNWAKILTFSVCILSATGALLMLLVDYEGNALAIVAYTLFGIAGLSLAYSVYLFVRLFPKIKNYFTVQLESRKFTRLLLRDFRFRTLIFTVGSFVMNLLFGLFNAYMGITNRSIWYSSLAGYYIALAIVRGSVLRYHKRRLGEKASDPLQEELAKAKIYLNSGGIMLLLNIALSVAIAQMIFSDAHFTYIGWSIFIYAAYTFFKITSAITSFIKAQKQTDLTVRTIRNINLTAALVSILALQTALLSTFSHGEIDVSLLNTFTGAVVSLSTVAIGVYMLVFAYKKIKVLKKDIAEHE